MNTVAIKEYLITKYNAQILHESLAMLEYYKIDIVMSFPDRLFPKHNDDLGNKSKGNSMLNMRELMDGAKHYPLSKLNIEVLNMKKNGKEIKIVLEHSLGYYTIKGLDEFDPDADDLSKELSKVGEKE